MSTIASPQRVRLGKTTGLKYLVFVLAFIVAGLAAFAGFRFLSAQNARYWVVTDNVPANVNLASIELKPIELSLGESAAAYLTAAQKPEGFTKTSLVAGQLLSSQSIATTSDSELVRVVLTSATPLSSSLRAGSQVAIWAAQKIGSDVGPVQLLASDAQVIKLVQGSSTPFSIGNQQAELQISQLSLPAVLDSLATDSAIYLVAQP